MLLAPSAPTGSSARAPGRDEVLPAVDDGVVLPETREELIDGRIVHAAPSHEPHATANSDLAMLLTAHAAEGYCAAVDLLTRTDQKNEFAPDASVFPRDKDPETGGRKLERLAFEICDTQTRADAAKRAAKLAARGVLRVFCIDVNEYEVLEWSTAQGEWRHVSLDKAIEDECLVRPLAVAALLDAIERDNEVARALLTKQNPVIVQRLANERAEGRLEGRLEGRREGLAKGEAKGLAKGEARGLAKGEATGEAKGLREAVRVACRVLGVDLSEAREAEIEAMDSEALRGWLAEIERTRGWPRRRRTP